MSGFPINRTNSIRCMVEGPGHTMLVGTIEGLITFSSDFSDYEIFVFILTFLVRRRLTGCVVLM